MAKICSYILCCCPKAKASKMKKIKTKGSTKSSPTNRAPKDWINESLITPSDISDSQLTEQLSAKTDKEVLDIIELKGYDFKNKQHIAKGGFATVYKINRIKDKQVLAIKQIDLKGYETKRDPKKYENLKNEIFIISSVKHKNVIQLFDHFIINNICYLVMEFANSGTIESKINTSSRPMTESEAKPYFKQMARAIEHLHVRDSPIAHRDLKLDNILLNMKNNELIIKVTDFGFSRVLNKKPNKQVFRAKSAVGTANYMSPQTIFLIYYNREIDDKARKKAIDRMTQFGEKARDVNLIKADIWSLGICLYVMVTKKYPFKSLNYEDIRNCMITIQKMYDWDKSSAKNLTKWPISGELIDLMIQMLKFSTSERMDIIGVVNHKWLKSTSDIISSKAMKI